MFDADCDQAPRKATPKASRAPATRPDKSSRESCAARRWVAARRATRVARPPRKLPAYQSA